MALFVRINTEPNLWSSHHPLFSVLVVQQQYLLYVPFIVVKYETTNTASQSRVVMTRFALYHPTPEMEKDNLFTQARFEPK